MAAPVFSARAFTAWQRALSAAFLLLATANLLELAVRLVAHALGGGAGDPAPLPLLVRRVFFLTALPWLASLVMRWICSARVELRSGGLAIEGASGTVEVPYASIAALVPWRVALPEAGFAVVLRSGARLERRLSNADPLALAAAIAERASIAGVDAHPALLDAHAKRRARWLNHPALQLGLIPAVLTFLLFRLHQIIAFGGLYGELHAFGARRWLNTLLGVALNVFCHLLVYRAGWRLLTAILALPAPRLPAPWGARSRWMAEAVGALGYFGALAAAIYLRFRD